MQRLTQEGPSLTVEVLDVDHYHPLVRAIRNVLSTPLAEVTYAQLIDGLPIVDTVWDMRGSLLLRGHPLIDHDRLCEGALERALRSRDTFDPAILRFDSIVMQSYQKATLGTREFKLRLVELVAKSVHQIAVLLSQLDDKLHSKEDIHAVVSWKKESQWVVEGRRRVFEEALKPRPTLFYHVDYMDYEQYPEGMADVAGYWAEDRIFGGIVVFDRGESGSECNDIYFHSGRQQTTFRVWRLLDDQFTDLVDFLLADNPPKPPFPILASQANRHRHDPWDAIALHHVFRDPWERRFPSTKPEETRDVRTVGDYPELDDMFDALQSADEAGHDADSN
ncbi:uncharacterized protein B0H64DRAFT_49151 [Chaetomium fimeti]|uniref:Uncharacterized protein n=1 Tax=Chaetomium fimeti TaxID=1854472 RepID=A0AAE0LMI6_9PEZI|nr:hypothetical protein B0H64DRAFT_49151 [Chaetomium fimeti]